jgi:hypothetical protein
MPYSKLRGKIVEKFHTQSAFADAMEMNKSTLNSKLSNRRQWTSFELVKACELLGITLAEAHLYFFCNDGCENATK